MSVVLHKHFPANGDNQVRAMKHAKQFPSRQWSRFGEHHTVTSLSQAHHCSRRMIDWAHQHVTSCLNAMVCTSQVSSSRHTPWLQRLKTALYTWTQSVSSYPLVQTETNRLRRVQDRRGKSGINYRSQSYWHNGLIYISYTELQKFRLWDTVYTQTWRMTMLSLRSELTARIADIAAK